MNVWQNCFIKLVGFCDIDYTGYLDRLYVHKDYQNQGIGTAICNELEQAFTVRKITTHSSITARPFLNIEDIQKLRNNRW